ncbi:hypothetical protein D3C72_1854370 [compost metagenome]
MVDDQAVAFGIEGAAQIGVDVDDPALLVDGGTAGECAESDQLVRGAVGNRCGVGVKIDGAGIDGRAAGERQHAEAGVLDADRARVGGPGIFAVSGVSGTCQHAGATEMGRRGGVGRVTGDLALGVDDRHRAIERYLAGVQRGAVGAGGRPE